MTCLSQWFWYLPTYFSIFRLKLSSSDRDDRGLPKSSFSKAIKSMSILKDTEVSWGFCFPVRAASHQGVAYLLEGVVHLGVVCLLGVEGCFSRVGGVVELIEHSWCWGILKEGNSICAVMVGGGRNAFGAKTSLAVMRGWCLSIWASMLFCRSEIQCIWIYIVTLYFWPCKSSKALVYINALVWINTKSGNYPKAIYQCVGYNDDSDHTSTST